MAVNWSTSWFIGEVSLGKIEAQVRIVSEDDDKSSLATMLDIVGNGISYEGRKEQQVTVDNVEQSSTDSDGHQLQVGELILDP